MAELILSLKDRELSRHKLGYETRVGRDPECDVYIDNVGVSRHHATLVWDGASFAVRDEHSSNGVFVNGARVSTHALKDGDVVQLGKFSLKLNLAGDGEQAPVSQGARSISSRDMGRTLALAPTEVQELIASQRGAQVARVGAEKEEADNSWTILIVGLLVIAVLAVGAYFLLIRR